jgi:glyoxylase-like metal-dependent hydrolase (beta-lactamase superfamily II)
MTREGAAAWQEIGERVFVRRYELFDQTIGVVIGAEGAVVIDTRTSHRRADELIADLRALSRAPIASVVNTHMHYDHTFGNARFRPAPIWGHVRCAAGMREGGEAKRRRVMEQLPELADELAEVEIVPPDQLFSDSAVLDLGDRQLELRFLGCGHTDNDIVILVPDAEVPFVRRRVSARVGGDGCAPARAGLRSGRARTWRGRRPAVCLAAGRRADGAGGPLSRVGRRRVRPGRGGATLAVPGRHHAPGPRARRARDRRRLLNALSKFAQRVE